MPEESDQSGTAEASGSESRPSRVSDRVKNSLQRSAHRRMQSAPPNAFEYGFIGIIAAINDCIDYATVLFSVSGVWLVILKIIDIATAAFLGFWLVIMGAKKSSQTGPVWKSRFWKWLFGFIVELVPFIGEMSPTWVITVFSVYREHKKAYEKAQASNAADRHEERQEEADELRQAQLQDSSTAVEEEEA